MSPIPSHFRFMSLFQLLAFHLTVSMILMTQVSFLGGFAFVAYFLFLLLGVVSGVI